MLLSQLRPNEGQINDVPANPRIITEEEFKKLKKSISSFRKMLSLRPMIVDEHFNILGGNMRYRALCRLRDERVKVGAFAFTDEIPDEWVHQDCTLSAAEKREFIIKDNQERGQNDWDMLANEWDAEELREWDVAAANWDDNLPSAEERSTSDEEKEDIGQFSVSFVFDNEFSFIKDACSNADRKQAIERKIIDMCREGINP